MDDENKVIQMSDYIDSGEELDATEDEEILEQPVEEAVPEMYIPYGVIMYRNKLYIIAGVFLVIGVAMAIYAKSFAPLVLVAASAYFVFKGLNAIRRFNQGLIREVPVLCTSVRPAAIGDHITVTFRTETEDEDDEGQEFFKFRNQPKKAADNFVVGHPYVIYFDVENPQALLYYIDL